MCLALKRLRATVPEAFWNARLADFDASLMERMGAWIGSAAGNLLLTGEPGTGKTHMAVALVRARLELGLPAAFKRMATFYRELRDSYGGDRTEESVLRQYIGAPMLALDDLGAGGLTDHERRYALELIDERANRLRSTVVTTNWSLEDIAAKMDERIASRLASYERLDFQGRDMRLR